MKLSDILWVASTGFYSAAAVVNFLLRRQARNYGGLILATFSLFAYGAIRLAAGSIDFEDQLAMAFALLLASTAPMQAAGLLSLYNPTQTRAFLQRLVFALACISLVYTAESVLGLGLRSEISSSVFTDFGMQRVRGPLYGPSTGYFLLLPAVGWALQSFFTGKSRKSYAVFCTVALLSALLGLGSRAALILLVLYVCLIATLLRRLKRSEATALFLAGLSLAVCFLIYSQADTQRLTKFEDVHRKLTYETAWNVLETESIPNLLAGQGYASIWPWYRRDTLRTEFIALGDNLVLTSFGPSLYHPHSTLIELMVEFGLAGLAWLTFLIIRTCRLPFVAAAGTGWIVFSLALVVSLLSFGFDLFIFKEVRVNSIWWLFLCAAFQLREQPEAGAV
ncbi:MAG: hypothetical protein NTW74_09110 [Acidobacteria bacterium]|nr:hypothetical protein [Acidobacteriota bacterium]